MNILLFGATGMVGQGVLRECLLDPDVQQVRIVGRTPTGIQHPKLRETIHRDLWRYSDIETDLFRLRGVLVCVGRLFCRHERRSL